MMLLVWNMYVTRNRLAVVVVLSWNDRFQLSPFRVYALENLKDHPKDGSKTAAECTQYKEIVKKWGNTSRG